MIVINLINQLNFYFIRIFIEDLGISRMVDLGISKIVLIRTDIIIGFFKLSL